MKSKYPYVVVFVLALVLGLVLRSCWQKQPVGNHPTFSTDFPSTDTLRVAVKDNTLEVQTPTGTQYKYVPEEGQAVVDVKKDGKPVITVTNKGFTRRFAADIFMADKLRIGGDCEFAYWNRFGALVGFGVSSNPVVVGLVGISYQLDQLKMNNTHVFIGMTTKKDIAVGARISF